MDIEQEMREMELLVVKTTELLALKMEVAIKTEQLNDKQAEITKELFDIAEKNGKLFQEYMLKTPLEHNLYLKLKGMMDKSIKDQIDEMTGGTQ